jgi:hypothetical protein
MKPRVKTKRSRREEVLIGGTITLLALGVFVFFVYQRLREIPVISIPTPTLPSPNAYDFYVKAGTNTVSWQVMEARDLSVYTLAQKQKALAANASHLKLFRQGMQYPCQSPVTRSLTYTQATNQSLANGHIRALARLLRFEAHVKAQEGDWSGAARSCVDALYLGQDVPRGGNEIASLVGYACEAIGSADAFRVAEKVNAADARTAAQRLEKMAEHRIPFTEAVQEDKWQNQAFLLQLFQEMSMDKAWSTLQANYQGNGQMDWKQVRENFKNQFDLARYGKSQILKNHAAYMDSCIERMKEPYPHRRPLPPVPPDPFSQLLQQDGIYKGWHKSLNAEMNHNLLTATFALRAYRLEKGTYPTTLEELVKTGYLKRLPVDPFAPVLGLPLHYRRLSQDTYLLYSVGTDGVDDGGKPIRQSDGTPWRWAAENTKGDFVKGKNTRP